jgi:anaerobic selenocysteine-containing dehydrogenase
MPERTVTTYCGLCFVGCPAVITVRDGQVVSLEPDRSHPQGGAVCAKGRAAPEILYHPGRLNYPMRRTRPKTDPDPGWERCSWDTALGLIAEQLLAVRARWGPQAVAFSKGTRGATGLRETEAWLGRLVHHFGSPNLITTTHLCQWPRDTGAAYYTFGTDFLPQPDVANSGCIVLWGSNPTATYLSLAQGVLAARARGAKLLVVDPRRVGLARRADLVLQVRPGTDGALALSLIHVLIAEERFDDAFVRDWTNAPLLVRDDSNRLLAADDLAGDPAGRGERASAGYVALDARSGALVPYDAAAGTYGDGAPAELALRGVVTVRLHGGHEVTCRPVFERLAQIAAKYPPQVASEITGVPAPDIVRAARLIAEHRPVSHYFWNGLVQHTNATQACRAIEVLYALLGDFDRPGGNVLGSGMRVNDVEARAALPAETAALRLGRQERPLGPAAYPGNVAAPDLYEAILEARPYPVRALLSFGNNMLLANGDTLRGRQALERLEFFAQAELFETPTSRFADVLLPAASFMEHEILNVSPAGYVQRRPTVVEPLSERRADVAIIFDLACRLGLGEHFWDGDLAAAYDHVLAPSGLSWEGLEQEPHGVPVPRAPMRYCKYAEAGEGPGPRGFRTPTRKAELFSDTFAAQGVSPLPEYEEPAHSPVRTPELARDFPLVLTNAKRAQYLQSQHRAVAGIRKTVPSPTAEIHPDTAAHHGVAHGDWIALETPTGRARLQAIVTDAIIPGVVCANHGWWQGCEELGLEALDPFSAEGANINLLVPNDRRDPVSGSTPHRSTLCRIRKVAPPDGT